MTSHRASERGQTLVFVAAGLVVLLAVVALAVDIGLAYSERRRMQNAADAGALAGAQALCWFKTDAEAIAEAKKYAQLNDADPPRIDPTKINVEIAKPSYVVTVSVTANVPFYFAPIFGISNSDVPATAAAQCGGSPTACGLWPIAFDLDLWNELRAGGSCDSGRYMYVWTGDRPGENDPVDAVGPDCTKYDCDIEPKPDGDGILDVFSDAGRAWVDFSDVIDPLYPDACFKAGGCGTDELTCRIRDLSGSKLTVPVCLAGDTGKKAGAGQAIKDMADHVVKIPLFDSRGCGPGCSGPDVNAPDSFYITELGCAIVAHDPWEKLMLKPISGSGQPWSDWVVKVAMKCQGCSSVCGTPNGPPVIGGVNGVILIK